MEREKYIEEIRKILSEVLEEGEELRISKDSGSAQLERLADLLQFVQKRNAAVFYPEKDLSREYADSIISAAVILYYVQAGLMLIDPENETIKEINPYALNLIGLNKEEVVGKDCHLFFCPSEEYGICKCSKENMVINAEGWLQNREGRKIPVLNTITNLFIRGKAYILSSFVDISKQKEIERDLNEQRLVAARNEKVYFELIEKSPNGIVHLRWDEEAEDFVFEGFNKSAERIEKINRTELLGKSLKDTFPGIMETEYYKTLKDVYEKGEYRELESYRFTNARVPGWRKSYLYKLSTGTVVSIFNDITEFVTTQKDLKTSMERFEVAVKGAKDGIFDFNLLQNELYLSPQWKEQLGYRDEEMKNEFILVVEAIHPDDRDRIMKVFNAYRAGELENYEEEFRLRHKDGSYRWILARADALRDENGVPTRIAGSHTDVTRIKEAAEELRIAKDLADAANRAKSEFLANMSHEIRTPMNAILGFTEIISNRLEQEELRTYINSISSSGKALLHLINDILDLSKIEAGRMEIQNAETDLKKILDELINVFKFNTQQKGLFFRVETGEDFPAGLFLDELRIRQILLNLAGNSIKFTEKGGVTIRAKIFDQNIRKHILTLVLEVEDTGMGIPEEEQMNIFNSFQQIKGQDQYKYGGTGLGLAITKRLTEIMGGEITLESRSERNYPENSGTIFRLTFRHVAYTLGRKPEQEEKAGSKVHLEPARIVVADDVEMNRNLIKGFLEGYPVEILEATNGEEAVALTKKEKPDLVLMDVKMPVMSGEEATKIIKSDKDTGKIPVIAITASVVKLEEESQLTEIYDSYLYKPVSMEQLLKTLLRFLKGSEIHEGKAVDEVVRADTEAVLLPADVLEKIEKHLLPEYNRIKDTYILARIEAFANTVTTFGKENDVHPLIKLGERLTEDVRTFDMEKLPDDLRSFSSLIASLKKAASKKPKNGK